MKELELLGDELHMDVTIEVDSDGDLRIDFFGAFVDQQTVYLSPNQVKGLMEFCEENFPGESK